MTKRPHPSDHVQDFLIKTRADGEWFKASGHSAIGDYLSRASEDGVFSRHQATRRFSKILSRAEHAPQLITIMGRRGAPDRAVVVMSMKIVDMIASLIEDRLAEDEAA